MSGARRVSPGRIGPRRRRGKDGGGGGEGAPGKVGSTGAPGSAEAGARRGRGGLAMAGRIWDDVVPEEDRVVFEAAGYGAKGGFGQRPALLVVDVTYDFCGDRSDEP